MTVHWILLMGPAVNMYAFATKCSRKSLYCWILITVCVFVDINKMYKSSEQSTLYFCICQPLLLIYVTQHFYIHFCFESILILIININYKCHISSPISCCDLQQFLLLILMLLFIIIGSLEICTLEQYLNCVVPLACKYYELIAINIFYIFLI